MSAAPDVRLAYNPGPVDAYGALAPPSVRLALPIIGGGAMGPENVARTLGAPTVRMSIPPDRDPKRDEKILGPPAIRLVAPAHSHSRGPSLNAATPRASSQAPSVRLAHHVGAQDENVLEGTGGVERLADDSRPALLVSFVYLKLFLEHRHRYAYRDWALDSGAFSAHNSGTKIDLAEYTETCKRLLAEDPTLAEVFALDVIGDYTASRRNAEAMWSAGVPAIPTFHVGTPWPELLSLAREYPKIALGGAVGYRRKSEWAAQCFARVWPKRIHGFGFGSERDVMALPWYSVDATNWEIGPCKFGRWQSFGRMSVRGSRQNLRAEVEWYLALERRAREKWRKRMMELDLTAGSSVRLAVSPGWSSVRLATSPGWPSPEATEKALGGWL